MGPKVSTFLQRWTYSSETNFLITHRLTKIIGLIQSTIKWPLLSGAPLSRWASGKTVILGDAAHAMLPYMSEGIIPYKNSR